ncbi:MAG: glucose-6-phosphate isomerase [Synechococcales cyanobacterium]
MQSLWQRYQEWLYYNDPLGLYLDISRMRFTSADVAFLTPKLHNALMEMKALVGGAIANPDEQRMVGHYWLRAPELAPSPEIKAAITDSITHIETFSEQIHSGALLTPSGERFTDVLWLGIGGSALGPQFVSQALAGVNPPLRIWFIDNTDPDGLDQIRLTLGSRLATTLVGVASKSGGTPETRNGLIEVQQWYSSAGLHFPSFAVAVTGPDSRLDQQAKTERWLATFPVFDWVGGRTSELSAVGLLPAALQGIPIQGLLRGAALMDEATMHPEWQHNPAALLAFAWYVAGQGRGAKDMVVLPYKDRLQLFSRYLQQLVMESLGKSHDLNGQLVNQGIAVYGNKGSTDQHAYVQQLRDGINNFFVTFIEVLHDRETDSPEVEPGITCGDYLCGLLQGTRQALYDNSRDSITVTVPSVSPQSVGALIALYERAVGLYASLIHVNAYHQPGVEAGKKAAASVLALQKRVVSFVQQQAAPIGLDALAKGLDTDPELVMVIVRHLANNQRSLTLSGNLGIPSQWLIAAR